MPGVFRPYTLVDVLGTINEQASSSAQADMINGLGQFAETDDGFTPTDSVSTAVQVNPAYDAGTWGLFSWG